jgi:hypothetical protein
MWYDMLFDLCNDPNYPMFALCTLILCDLFTALAYDMMREPNDTKFDAMQPRRKSQTLILVPCTKLNSINSGDQRFEALQFCLHHA